MERPGLLRGIAAFLCSLLLLSDAAVKACLIPIGPIGTASANGDADWPCKNHGCGCDTREKCLTNCCCRKPRSPAPDPPSCCQAKKPVPPAEAFLRRLACHGALPGDPAAPFHLQPLLPAAEPSVGHLGPATRLATEAASSLEPFWADFLFRPPRPA